MDNLIDESYTLYYQEKKEKPQKQIPQQTALKHTVTHSTKSELHIPLSSIHICNGTRNKSTHELAHPVNPEIICSNTIPNIFSPVSYYVIHSIYKFLCQWHETGAQNTFQLLSLAKDAVGRHLFRQIDFSPGPVDFHAFLYHLLSIYPQYDRVLIVYHCQLQQPFLWMPLR